MQTGIYDNESKRYTSYFDGVTEEFDLSRVLTESDVWEWTTAGAFQTKEEERTYIALIDFNLALEEGKEPSPQILLLDYATDDPKDYHVTPYTVEPPKEFCWVDQCYRLNDKIYIASSRIMGSDGEMQHLGAIDLKSKEFYDCKDEWQNLSRYAKSKFEKGYAPFFFRTVLEQDDVIVYSAAVSEADDIPCIGAVFMACKEGVPAAYMSCDFRCETLQDGIEIDYVENGEETSARESDQQIIVQEKEAWDYSDVIISDIPEDASIRAIASNGIYYQIQTGIDYSKEEPTTENEFHFLDSSGNDRMLLQKKDMHMYNTKSVGDNMLLCNVTEDGMEIIQLSPDGNIQPLFHQNAPQFPFNQTCEQYMVSIRNHFVEDSHMYENILILEDMEKKEEKVIYSTLWDNENGIGEDLGCVSINNETVCFTLNKEYKDKKSEHVLFLYDIEKEKIVEEIPLRTRVCYAAYGGEGGLLLSETDDSKYLEEAGSLGYIENGAYVETAKVPLISASNLIRDARYTGEGYYFTTVDAAYYWNTKANEIFVFDNQWLENKKSRIWASDDGLKYVGYDGDSTFIRTLWVR